MEQRGLIRSLRCTAANRACSSTGNTLSLVTPPHGNIAPPGYYMSLFLLDSAGVPSKARFHPAHALFDGSADWHRCLAGDRHDDHLRRTVVHDRNIRRQVLMGVSRWLAGDVDRAESRQRHLLHPWGSTVASLTVVDSEGRLRIRTHPTRKITWSIRSTLTFPLRWVTAKPSLPGGTATYYSHCRPSGRIQRAGYFERWKRVAISKRRHQRRLQPADGQWIPGTSTLTLNTLRLRARRAIRPGDHCRLPAQAERSATRPPARCS